MASQAHTTERPGCDGQPPAQLPPDSASRLRDALCAAGYRYTTQRAAVFAYLAGTCAHPSADDIYRAVSSAMPQISLATVYNALDTLVEVKLVTRLEGAHHTARYDATRDPHYHLRDIATGEIRDLDTDFDPELLAHLDPQLGDRLAREGFEITGYRLEVLGKFQK